MSVHDGHRQRLRTRFQNEGLENFEEVQVLELLLFYCIPRQDTNPIAHRLIERFGNINRVLEAPVSELRRIDGISDGAAQYLRLVMETIRYCGMKNPELPKILTTVDACGKFLQPFFKSQHNELVYLLCLDSKCKVLSCKMVGEGSVNSAGVPIRRIVELALGENATSVVLAHNHPSGLAVPSDEDRATTARLAKALNAVEITLADHIVFADDDYVSLAQSGLYDHRDYQAV